ncbi:glutamyl-tRNA reductase [Deltaproteobacteria bacterium]|nr:glutamyl-tRNA reductase [Deltaproteobacteria bacterium]
MVRIVNIGMNHESAPVDLRECMANEQENSGLALSCMRESEWIKEGLFVSTCNRVEALYTTENPEEAKKSIISMYSRIGNIPEEQFISNIYTHEDGEALKHIFRVASSLDSMIVGEPQILGQIKEAYYQAAVIEKTSGVILNRLMHRAFHVAKRVKTETGISEAAVSISYAAVELAKKIFYGLKGRKVLLIGAGEMAELAARNLMGNGVESLVVANRSFNKAVQVADLFKGKAVFFEEIGSYLLEADIVITSTASMDPIISHDLVRNSLRKRRNRPLFFIDIAVPRDVDQRVNELENVYLYDIDDLKEVIEENSAHRKEESLKAERIVQEEVIRFEKWLKTLDVVPTIVSIKDKIEIIRKAEVGKSLSVLGELTTSQIEAIEALTISLADKIINDPVIVLKDKADRRSRDVYLDVARKLFNLDKNDNERN